MSQILAFDTASPHGSLAYWRDGAVEEEVPLHAPDGYSEVLCPALLDLLHRHGSSLAAIDCFGSTAGPGTFTGVRLGLTLAKGLAEVAQRPVCAISNLQALAALTEGSRRCPIIDARRGEVYTALYDDALQVLLPEQVVPFPQWLATLPDGPVTFVSPDFALFREALYASRWANAPVLDGQRLVAGAVARLTAQQWQAGRAGTVDTIDANYLRRTDAEVLWDQAR